MTTSFNRRVAALEQARKPKDSTLPNIVEDDIDDAEFERLEALGLKPVRFTDALAMFI